MEPAYVYMMTNKRNGTLYIGRTSNLDNRIAAHQQRLIKGFTHDYWLIHLVWYTQTESVEQAAVLEFQMKKWKRAWKVELIEKTNPYWKDLAAGLVDIPPPSLPPPLYP